MKFTQKQIDLLNYWLEVANDSCGATTWEELKDDNHSFADITDLAEKASDKYSKPQVVGIVASLVDKFSVILDDTATKNNKRKVWYIDDSTIDEMIELNKGADNE